MRRARRRQIKTSPRALVLVTILKFLGPLRRDGKAATMRIQLTKAATRTGLHARGNSGMPKRRKALPTTPALRRLVLVLAESSAGILMLNTITLEGRRSERCKLSAYLPQRGPRGKRPDRLGQALPQRMIVVAFLMPPALAHRATPNAERSNAGSGSAWRLLLLQSSGTETVTTAAAGKLTLGVATEETAGPLHKPQLLPQAVHLRLIGNLLMPTRSRIPCSQHWMKR
mmetsp:Transcript_24035/g.73621  ORF Transcript_24035/g.73621 Transcript_24035/m.73621 type:complete len:228 (+) Transcript_24035:63-746(+)